MKRATPKVAFLFSCPFLHFAVPDPTLIHNKAKILLLLNG
jgi:hypothetical protein